MKVTDPQIPDAARASSPRVAELFQEQRDHIIQHADRLFSRLMLSFRATGIGVVGGRILSRLGIRAWRTLGRTCSAILPGATGSLTWTRICPGGASR